jgi:drug/metabolite transporter (DMT)-like permease
MPAVESTDAHHPPRSAILLGYAIVYVVWGSTYLAILIAVETMPPFLMAASRFLAAGAVLYAWRRMRGERRPPRSAWQLAAVTGALLLLGGNGLVSWAEQRIDSGIAALLVATTPMFVALLDWARPGGVRTSPRGAAGLVLGFAGAAVLVGWDSVRGHGPIDPLGALAVTGATLSWAAGSLYIARRKMGVSPALGSGMQMLCGGALLLLVGLAAGEPARLRFDAISAGSLLALGYLTVFGSLVAFSAYGWLLKHEPPARVATYAYVNPVVAVLLGWAFRSEPITIRTLVASLMIVTAVVLITTSRARGAGRAKEPTASRREQGVLVTHEA